MCTYIHACVHYVCICESRVVAILVDIYLISDIRLVSPTDVHHRQSACECYSQGQFQIPQGLYQSDEEDELYEEVWYTWRQHS